MKKNVKKMLSWLVLCAVSISPLAGQQLVCADDSIQGRAAKSSISGVHLVEMNSEVNNAAMVTEDDVEVLELGAPTAEEGAQVVGVKADNPFADNEELIETWTEAFTNYGVTFNGLTYNNSLREGYKTVAMYGRYFNGVKINSKNQVQLIDMDTEIAFTTKEKAQEAFELARKYLVDNNYLGANGVAAQMIAQVEADESILEYQNDALKEYLYKLAAVKGAAVTNAEAVPAELVQYIYSGPARGYGALPEPNTIEGEFSYPLPEWTKGVSISTWVKVPKDATGTAPIFAFVKDRDNALILRTDGTFVFAADESGNNVGSHNQYVATFTGSTPYDNKGEWVYVTLTVKNDEVNVYYNGKKAVETLGKRSIAGRASYFNGGFGKKAWGTDEERIEAILKAEWNSYMDLLRYFDEEENPDYSDFSKYYHGHTTLMIEFLTDRNSWLYIGGYTADTIKSWQIYDGNGEWYGTANEDETGLISPNKDKGWGAYNGYCQGMCIGAMDFCDYPASAEEAAGMYEKALVADRSFKQIEENTPTPSQEPTAEPSPTTAPTSEPLVWEDFSEFVSEDGFSVLELRNQTDIEPGIGCIGREIDNPFAGNEELYESWTDAFTNYGVTFNGLIYDNPIKANKKTVAGYGKYFGGLNVRNDRVQIVDANFDTNVATFSTKEKAQKAFEEARKFLFDGGGTGKGWLGSLGEAARWIQEIEADESGLTYLNEELKEYLYKLRSVTGEALVNEEAIPAELVSYIYFGPARGYGVLPEPNTIEGEFSYPLPKWTKGVSISTWVKVPEDATGTAPIFAFVKDTDMAMTLRTDGTFVFAADDSGTRAGKDNQYVATFTGSTPYDNKGEWVYVTLTVKNDEVNVYYNGEKAVEALGRYSKAGKAKYFNGGFGKKAWGTDEERIEEILRGEWNSYVDLLRCFDEDENPDYSDFSKYNHGTGTLMIDFLADYKTGLYIGGYKEDTLKSWYILDGADVHYATENEDGTGRISPNKDKGWGAFNGYCNNMRIGAMDFQDYPVTVEEAAGIYEKALVTDRSFNQAEEDIPTSSARPSAVPTPSAGPSAVPTPSAGPSAVPISSAEPTAVPASSVEPTAVPASSAEPTAVPAPSEGTTAEPMPSIEPTAVPVSSAEPTVEPMPSTEPTTAPVSSAEPTTTPSPEPTVSSKPATGIETTTEQIVNEDGTVTDKVTEKETKEDGTISEKVTETTEKEDGSIVEKVEETITNADGSKETTSKETIKNSDGTVTEEEVRRLKDEIGLLTQIISQLKKIAEDIYEHITKIEKTLENGMMMQKEIKESSKVEEDGTIVKETGIVDTKKDEQGKEVEKYEYSTKALPEDVEWKTEVIEEVQEEEKQAIEDMGAKNYVMFDIIPESNGSKVDVKDDRVKVSLFGGNKWKNKNVKVFDFKKGKWLDAIVEGDYVSFYAEHFSKYAIAEVAEEVSDVKKGDADLDGQVKLTDAQLVLKAALNLTKLSVEQTKAADVDGNGKVDLTDAQMILKAALNLIVLS